MSSQQGLYTALFSEIETNKTLKDLVSFSETSRPMNFDILDSLNLNESNIVSESNTKNNSNPIENTHLINASNALHNNNLINEGNTVNEQLPTPLTSFIETIYPSSHKSNRVRHEITPIVDVPGSQLSSNIANVNKLKTEIKTTKFNRNFQEEAASLTRRIVSGKLRTMKNNTDARKELFVRKNITSVDDLMKKKVTPTNDKKIIIREERIENIIQESNNDDEVGDKTLNDADNTDLNLHNNIATQNVQASNSNKALITPTNTRFDKNVPYNPNLQNEDFFEPPLYFNNNVLESTDTNILAPEFFAKDTPNLSAVLTSFVETSPVPLMHTNNTMQNLLNPNSSTTSPHNINSSLESLHNLSNSIDNFSPLVNMQSTQDSLSPNSSHSSQNIHTGMQNTLSYEVMGMNRLKDSTDSIHDIANLLQNADSISDNSHYEGEPHLYHNDEGNYISEENANYYENENTGYNNSNNHNSHDIPTLDNNNSCNNSNNNSNNMMDNMVKENVIFSDIGVTKTVPSYLSLVEQLNADKPLLKAVYKKQKRGSYRCAHCPETFSNIMEYAEHMDIFNIKREYKCPFPLCAWKILGLPRRSDLRRHCAIQHKTELRSDLKQLLNLKDETYPIIQCDNGFCDKEFYRKDAYNRHIAIVHDNKKSRFNKKLNYLLKTCPSGATEKEKYDFVKTNIFKKKVRKRSKKDKTAT